MRVSVCIIIINVDYYIIIVDPTGKPVALLLPSLCNPLLVPVSHPDVCARDEAEEVPLYRELLICSQSGGAGCLDVHEEQQL